MTQQADDIAVLKTALGWLKKRQQVALATVCKTWGSSPRPPGSLLAMNNAGQFTGSLTGGCIEETLAGRFRDGEIAGPLPTIIDFGVDRQEATRMGLPCGGRIEILVETVTDAATLDDLLTRINRGELVARRIDLLDGTTTHAPGTAGNELQVTKQHVIKTFGPMWRLLIVGDGQLARHLAGMAIQLDYHVTICDPRDIYVTATQPEGVTFIREMPDDAVMAIHDQPRTAIIALAHDPKQDDLALNAALDSNAFYIGALGSRKSALARRERLASLGRSPQQLARIHGPAGLPIGSKRPAEIAVSILAEITAIRNEIKADAT